MFKSILTVFPFIGLHILISFSFWMTLQFIFKVSFKFWGRNIFIYLQGFTFYNGVYKIIFFYKIYFKKSYHAFACLCMVQWPFAFILCIFLNTVRIASEASFKFYLEKTLCRWHCALLETSLGGPTTAPVALWWCWNWSVVSRDINLISYHDDLHINFP